MRSKPLSITCWSLLLSSLLYGSFIGAQESPPIDRLRDLDNLVLFVEQLESSENLYAANLIEPLQQLAGSLMNVGRHNDAHSVLDRAMHITRINQGLYSGDQLPLLQLKIENLANTGDWESSRQQMDHLRWLLSSGNLVFESQPLEILESMMDALLLLSKMHLRGIAEDDASWQGFHFRQAENINRAANSAAQRYWEESDPRLTQILYRQVKHYHLQSIAIDRGGSTGYKLRKLFPSSSQIRDRRDVQRIYYIQGLILLNKIRENFVNSATPNPEAAALASLYIADWQVLFNHRDEAAASYRVAYDGLLAANIDADLLTDFFDHPVLLPQPEFYTSLDKALEARSADNQPVGGISSDSVLPNLTFREWSATFPNVQTPIELPTTEAETLGFASFAIDLAGIERQSLRINSRYRTGISAVDEVQLIFRDMAPNIGDEELEQKLYWLRFRPVLVGGVPQHAQAVLNYFFTIAN